MCVKLVTSEKQVEFDTQKPLESQMKGLQKVVINYAPFDEQIKKFIQEIERFSNSGISFSFDVEVNHNSKLTGFKTQGKLDKTKSDITFNEIIKLIDLTHQCADRKMSELVNYCIGK